MDWLSTMEDESFARREGPGSFAANERKDMDINSWSDWMQRQQRLVPMQGTVRLSDIQIQFRAPHQRPIRPPGQTRLN